MGTKSGHSSRRVFVILMLAAVILCMLLLADEYFYRYLEPDEELAPAA